MNIKKLRTQAHMTQALFAKRLGVKQSAVAQWEIGMTLPRTSMLPLIANLCKCRVDDLYTEEELSVTCLNDDTSNHLSEIDELFGGI